MNWLALVPGNEYYFHLILSLITNNSCEYKSNPIHPLNCETGWNAIRNPNLIPVNSRTTNNFYSFYGLGRNSKWVNNCPFPSSSCSTLFSSSIIIAVGYFSSYVQYIYIHMKWSPIINIYIFRINKSYMYLRI